MEGDDLLWRPLKGASDRQRRRIFIKKDRQGLYSGCVLTQITNVAFLFSVTVNGLSLTAIPGCDFSSSR